MLEKTWETLSAHVEALVTRRWQERTTARDLVETVVAEVYGEAETPAPVETPVVTEVEVEIEQPAPAPATAQVVSLAELSQNADAAREAVKEAFDKSQAA